MAVIKTYDLARMSSLSTGTGSPITLDAAATVNGVLYLTFAQAGVSTGEVVIYSINDATGGNSECGYGTYTSGSPPTLTRNVLHSTNSNAAINLSGSATVALTALAENLMLGSIVPQGRLTLSAGVQVMTSTVSGATTIYYTPYGGNLVPIYNGAFFVNTAFTETSQATTDTTKSPAAVGSFNAGAATNIPAAYDMFVWNDSGTIRCTRGPAWTYSTSGTAIISTATPAVVTWNSHGLTEGAPVILTGSTLPTGLSANTLYYVTRSPTTNTFTLSTSLANAAAGTTVGGGGSSSGTQTVTNYTGSTTNTASRGTGAGTTELELVNGIWTNKNAITNGPAANKGTYVGTVVSNTSSQIDFIFGAIAAGGTAAKFGVWNAYNRVPLTTTVGDSTNSWTYNGTAPQALNAGATGAGLNNRISMLRGLQIETVDARLDNIVLNGTLPARVSIGLDSTTTISTGTHGTGYNNAAAGAQQTPWFTWCGDPGLGWHYLQALQWNQTAENNTWYGNGGDTTRFQNGLRATLYW